MLRYYALATVVVLAVLLVVVALPQGPARDGATRYAAARGTPGPAQRDRSARAARDVSGDAPWALGALPECLRQTSVARGTLAFVRASVPAGARRLRAGTRIAAADCRMTLAADGGIVVRRGANVLRVPPPARVSVAGARIVLDTSAGARGEVRIFAAAPGAHVTVGR